LDLDNNVVGMETPHKYVENKPNKKNGSKNKKIYKSKKGSKK